jgi:hypothetical protein
MVIGQDGKMARRQDGKMARRQDGKTARWQDGNFYLACEIIDRVY